MSSTQADSDLDDDDYAAIADKVLDKLETGIHGDHVLLTRRQAVALSTGALSLGALGTLGADQATAQASDIASEDTSDGQVGAPGSPEDVVIDQLRDPGGDEVFNIDDTGAVNAQPREWIYQTLQSSTYQLDGGPLAQSVAASGSVTLSSGSATVDTGITATGATFTLALGVDDPGADVDLSGRLFFDTSVGTYKIEIVEATTSVGNPTANYDVVRVR